MMSNLQPSTCHAKYSNQIYTLHAQYHEAPMVASPLLSSLSPLSVARDLSFHFSRLESTHFRLILAFLVICFLFAEENVGNRYTSSNRAYRFSMETFEENVCFICGKDLQSGAINDVKEKGISSLINSSEKRQDGKAALIVGLKNVRVHQKCRKLYTNEKSINAFLKRPREVIPGPEGNPPLPPQPFNFRTKCLFCAEEITEDFLAKERKKPPGKRIDIYKIRSANGKEGIIKAAKKNNDDWSEQVMKTFANLHTDFLVSSMSYTVVIKSRRYDCTVRKFSDINFYLQYAYVLYLLRKTYRYAFRSNIRIFSIC